MKNIKKIFTICLTVLMVSMVLPFSVKASDEIVATDLKEACTEEGITFNHDDFANVSGKANIYIFRGNGCPHCQELLTYLESIVDTEGSKFNVETFEVWNNEANADLMEKVAKAYGEEASGVPYVVIGEKTFSGYDESMNQELLDAIDTLYTSDDKYDVMSYLDGQGELDGTSTGSSTDTNLMAVIIVEVLNLIVLAIVLVTNNRKYDAKINELKTKIKELESKKTEIKATKEETKTVKPKKVVQKTKKKE